MCSMISKMYGVRGFVQNKLLQVLDFEGDPFTGFASYNCLSGFIICFNCGKMMMITCSLKSEIITVAVAR